MEPIHIVTDKEKVSELVLMPGDPLRAKYIAENFLDDAILINKVRNMLGYTGFYKGVRVTVIASGMGIPSMGIYSYELAKFYGVKKIIRVGTAGSLSENVHIRDLVVATSAHSLSSFALAFSGEEKHVSHANSELLDNIRFSLNSKVNVHFGEVITSDAFDIYSNHGEEKIKMLECSNPLATEMETFGLYYMGEITDIETSTILSITDSKFTPDIVLSPLERERSLDDMITLALEAIIK